MRTSRALKARLLLKVNGFYVLAALTGAVALTVGGLVLAQWLGPGVVRTFVPGVLPVVGLAAGFWGVLTVLLVVAGRLSRRRGPGGPTGGGEPLGRPSLTLVRGGLGAAPAPRARSRRAA